MFYWSERNHEVDFIARRGRHLTAIEVKSGRAPLARRGMAAFSSALQPQRPLPFGGDGIPVGEFLGKPAEAWLA